MLYEVTYCHQRHYVKKKTRTLTSLPFYVLCYTVFELRSYIVVLFIKLER